MPTFDNSNLIERARAIQQAALEQTRGSGKQLNLATEQFVALGRSVQEDPRAADFLIELMTTNSAPEVRQASYNALQGSNNPRAAAAVRLEDLLRKVASTHSGESASHSREELKQFVNDPHFVERMLFHVTINAYGAEEVAQAIRETPLSDKQAKIRSIIEGNFNTLSEFSRRDQLASLPLALDPNVPANRELLKRSLTFGGKSTHGHFEASVVRALADSQSPDAINFLHQQLLAFDQYKAPVIVALANAFHDNPSTEVRAKLLPLIDGSIVKTAWTLSGLRGNAGMPRVIGALGMLAFDRAEIYDRRVEVAMALPDADLKIARKAIDDASDLSHGHRHVKCHSELTPFIDSQVRKWGSRFSLAKA